MPSPSLSLTVPLCLCIFVSLLLKPLQALSPPSSSSSNLPLLLLPISNLTTSSTTNTSSSENPALRLHCTGEHFGFNPNIADCESAKEHITPDSVQYTWGARHTGLGPTVIPLPYRIMGGQCAKTIPFPFHILISHATRFAHWGGWKRGRRKLADDIQTEPSASSKRSSPTTK